MIFPKNAILSIEQLIEREEAAYRAQIQEAANMILCKKARFVFLAGPSCSGKSTTALCLERALEKANQKVLTFSTDDFFFDQEKAPKNSDGTPNYDAFEHTDSALITETITSFSRGNHTSLPTFDFFSGKRIEHARTVNPGEYDIFLLEGIHALNDVILEKMPKDEPYLCFYLDVTESVQSEAGGEALSPHQIRFCRRLIRDFKHRGASAELTRTLWNNVLASEKEILHPFRKNAEMTLATNFSYEIPVEKGELVPLLSNVKVSSPLYPEAERILSILAHFPTLSENLVPPGSVLREFID